MGLLNGAAKLTPVCHNYFTWKLITGAGGARKVRLQSYTHLPVYKNLVNKNLVYKNMTVLQVYQINKIAVLWKRIKGEESNCKYCLICSLQTKKWTLIITNVPIIEYICIWAFQCWISTLKIRSMMQGRTEQNQQMETTTAAFQFITQPTIEEQLIIKINSVSVEDRKQE